MPNGSQQNERDLDQEAKSTIDSELKSDNKDLGIVQEPEQPEDFPIIRQDELIQQYGFHVTRIVDGEYYDATPTTKYITERSNSYEAPFFIVMHPCELVVISEVHPVAGTDGGAVTLDVKKATGTQSISGGTSLLAATFDLKSTANTVVSKAGNNLATGNVTKFDTGDRIGLVLSGTPTAITGVTVTAYFKYIGRGDFLIPKI